MSIRPPVSAGSSGAAATSAPVWLPSDLSYIAWTFDPLLTNNVGGPGINATVGSRVVIRATTAVTNLVTLITTGGSGFTAARNYGYLWASDGTLIAKTADQATPWGSTGVKTMALTAESGQSLTLAAGTYVVGLNLVATSRPQFARLSNTNATAMNLGTGSMYRAWYKANSDAEPGAPLSGLSSDTIVPWLALS